MSSAANKKLEFLNTEDDFNSCLFIARSQPKLVVRDCDQCKKDLKNQKTELNS